MRSPVMARTGRGLYPSPVAPGIGPLSDVAESGRGVAERGAGEGVIGRSKVAVLGVAPRANVVVRSLVGVTGLSERSTRSLDGSASTPVLTVPLLTTSCVAGPAVVACRSLQMMSWALEASLVAGEEVSGVGGLMF